MYKEVDMSLWQGRIDETADSLRWHQCIKPYAENVQKGVVLLGVASDEGVKRNKGRIGAANGPDHIRMALGSQAFHLQQPVYDAGNLYCQSGQLEEMQNEQGEVVQAILDQGHFPLLLGGGHEIAFGSFPGLQRHLIRAGKTGTIGIINFDAHFDLRREIVPTSGTPFLQIADYCHQADIPFHYLCLGISEGANTGALFAEANQLGVEFIKDEEINNREMDRIERKLQAFVNACTALYLSIDLDVLPAATAPGVSAPASRGVPLGELEQLLSHIRLVAGDRLRLADIAEYNPGYDIDSRTAKTAARLCHLLTR